MLMKSSIVIVVLSSIFLFADVPDSFSIFLNVQIIRVENSVSKKWGRMREREDVSVHSED